MLRSDDAQHLLLILGDAVPPPSPPTPPRGAIDKLHVRCGRRTRSLAPVRAVSVHGAPLSSGAGVGA
jgi:hypothetical protein